MPSLPAEAGGSNAAPGTVVAFPPVLAGLLGSAWGWGGGARRRDWGHPEEQGGLRAFGLRGRLQRVLTLAKISPLLKTELGERFLALKKRWNFF